jgi:gliding motility-associated-like protein
LSKQTGIPACFNTIDFLNPVEYIWGLYSPKTTTFLRVAYPIILIFILLANFRHLIAQPACETTTFQKIFGFPGIDDDGFDIVETPDQGFITGGWASGFEGKAMLAKFDRNGNIVWLNQLLGSTFNKALVTKIRKTKDGNYLAAANLYRNDSHYIWIIKFNENGGIIWNKELTYPNGLSNNHTDIIESADGGIVIVGGFQAVPNFGGALVLKLDGNGNILWNKGFQSLNINGTLSHGCVLEKNGVLYIGGHDYVSHGAVIIRMNTSDGSFLNATTLQIENQWLMPFTVEEKNNRIYINIWDKDRPLDLDKQVVLIMDFNLNVINLQKLDFGYKRMFQYPVMWSGDEKGIVVATSRENYGDLTLTKFSEDGAIIWNRSYYYPGSQIIYGLKPTSDHGVIAVGVSNTNENPWVGGSQDMFLVKADREGRAGNCDETQPALTIFSPAYTKGTIVYSYTDLVFIPVSHAINVTPVPLPAQTLCEKIFVPACTSFQISGEDTVCKLGDQKTYTLTKNNGCNLPINWKVDESFAEVISSTDNQITIKYKKAGEIAINASVTELCSEFGTEFKVGVFESPSTINLGPDRSICENNTVTLSRGTGFKEYQWQDGSTGPDYVVTAPGKYYLTATDFCYNIYSDTVLINPAPNPGDFLPGDTAICKGSETLLQSIIGFDKYQWSTGETTRQITITLPGSYSLTATNALGCFATEEIVVGEKTDCVTDLFIPKAFSPNKDGRNEIFKGVAYGILKKFHLTVFNRYGNIVFESRDINKGWDGKFSGQDQDTGNFVWTCEYQFQGYDVEKRKGNVVLIR